MTNLGKIANSFFSATNENTLALANLNFDFAILKYEAPKEFQVVGTNLSSRRRGEAEDGKTHRIAGRLGALFKSIVPATPHLFSAYGKRASEIAASPNINPKISPKYGPFAEFVGIDGTSLWAAATSAKLSAGTHAPLAMYLLACILARRWDPSIAISIWTELVEQRQKEIEASLQDDPQHISLFMAAKHEISRDDLASWDASARAWIQSADEAKCVARTKFDLIAKNISVEVGSGQQTYQNVIEVWQCALRGMELLVQGTPQELSSGAILLALSAWHLYPDLIVLGKTTKRVNFEDPLISTGGTITIGLQYAHEVREPGMHWSLTLSHLRYYEQDVKVNARNDISRISMNELLVIAFGDLMKSWGVSAQNDDDAAMLLIELRHQILNVASADLVNGYDPEWLRVSALAGQEFLTLKQSNASLCLELVGWGRRRARNFLGSQGTPPFFGLIDPCVTTALTAIDGHEAAISYFRKMVELVGDPSRTYVIRYQERRHPIRVIELVSVTQHMKSSNKRDLDGSLKSEHFYQRWLCLTTAAQTPNRCHCDSCGMSCPCITSQMPCQSDCHRTPRACQGFQESDINRKRDIEALGEACQWIPHQNVYAGEEQHAQAESFIWRFVPSMLRIQRSTTDPMLQLCPSIDSGYPHCTCAEPASSSNDMTDNMIFEKVYGNVDSYCLFASSLSPLLRTHSEPKATSEVTKSHINRTLSTIKSQALNKDMLRIYLACYDSTRDQFTPSSPSEGTDRRINSMISGFDVLVTYKDRMLKRQYIALTALNFAHRLYNHLPGASIPLTITATTLSTVEWTDYKDHRDNLGGLVLPPIEPVDVEQDQSDEHISTARCFACIVLFESGTYNVSVSDCLPLIAVASGNSIFVANYLMSDPANSLHEKRQVRRIVGNVGTAGISMLVTPQQNLRI